jgi:uncharacterized damage-inducible protein DinB
VTLIEEMRDLVRYDEWANSRLVAALGELSGEELATPVASSFGSLRDTLAHIVGAEWIWFRRWTGSSPGSAPTWAKDGGLAELTACLREIEEDRRLWLDGLGADDLEASLGYRSLAGKESRNRLADQIRHVVNHSTYHRGQAATQLRQLGRVPPATDFILYRREVG